MTLTPRTLFSLALTVAAGSLLSGCIVVPVGHRHHGGGVVAGGGGTVVVNGGGDVVAVAPPPLQAEVIVAPPGPGYFWIGGYWNWLGGRHAWVGGRWESQRSGYQWAPHQWRREGTAGAWRRGAGTAADRSGQTRAGKPAWRHSVSANCRRGRRVRATAPSPERPPRPRSAAARRR